MSRSGIQDVSFWTDVERIVQRYRSSGLLTRNADPTGSFQLSERAGRILADCITLWALVAYDTSPSDVLDRRRRVFGWVSFLLNHGPLRCISDCKSLDDLLIEDAQYVTFQTYKRFKRVTSEAIPNVGEILAPIKDRVELWFTNRDPEDLRAIRTFLLFPSRLNLPDREDLVEKALQAYLDGETRLVDLTVDQAPAAVLERWFPRDPANRARKYPCHPLLYEWFDPWHGPGAVADARGKSLQEKFAQMRTDPKLQYVLNKTSLKPYEDFSISQKTADGALKRCARSVCVPKSYDKLRTICMEPVALQWAQQGFARSIVRYVSAHKTLRKRIDLERAELNTQLAWEASIDGSFATIDLSSASDSVSWTLVREWFHDTALREILTATRSDSFDLESRGPQHTLKFAPMGSALCFPVECLVFAAIVESTIEKCGDRPCDSRYRVYGDDIIVEAKYAPAVMSTLVRCGFVVNTDKTHYRTDSRFFFRESCGGEYLAGEDITPMRIPRRFKGCTFSANSPEHVLGMIEMANKAIHHPLLRRYLIHRLSLLPKSMKVRFSVTGEGGIFSPQCTNFHLPPPEWDEDTQAYYVRVGQLEAVYQGRVDQRCKYFATLRSIRGRTSLTWPEDRVSVEVRAPKRLR